MKECLCNPHHRLLQNATMLLRGLCKKTSFVEVCFRSPPHWMKVCRERLAQTQNSCVLDFHAQRQTIKYLFRYRMQTHRSVSKIMLNSGLRGIHLYTTPEVDDKRDLLVHSFLILLVWKVMKNIVEFQYPKKFVWKVCLADLHTLKGNTVPSINGLLDSLSRHQAIN